MKLIIAEKITDMRMGDMNDTYHFMQFGSEIGTIFVACSKKGVSRVVFGRDEFKRYLDGLDAANMVEGGAAAKSAEEIKNYLGGRSKDFDVELDLSSGTTFQVAVWKELLTIPYGSVRTYGEIAKRIGKPGAARAVGNAVGSNPIPIIVPCHRVVATNGLGGYSCGIEIKKKLLEREGVIP